ncbi:hypothetical protein LSH36_844g00032 [Paralvinella palmiformis]|uniref:Uncharacterized protein n=1 Tax=Paralvinella palmiformis TaxID=53620 RepID=A0AAD9IZF6_9ANNE|nr:hypothetical protein LSH36_844g00032 [Paralvinella palmiformis]
MPESFSAGFSLVTNRCLFIKKTTRKTQLQQTLTFRCHWEGNRQHLAFQASFNVRLCIANNVNCCVTDVSDDSRLDTWNKSTCIIGNKCPKLYVEMAGYGRY